MVSFARSLKTSLLLTSLNLDGAKFDQVCLGKKKKKKKNLTLIKDANDCTAFWLSLIGKHGSLQHLSLVNCSGLEMALAFRP